MRVRIRLVLLFTLGFTLLFTFFAQKGYYTQKFNAEYWKDKYDQSPWQLPLSTRPIGDDGLYLYQGYAIIRGADPSLLSAEVPPLGKYLIGLFTVLSEYPAFYGIFVGALTLWIFYLLCQKILKNTSWSLFATLLLALDPLFVNQWHLTMLDNLYLFFILSVFFLLAQMPKSGKTKTLLLTCSIGLALGFMAETKAPLFIPHLVLVTGFVLFKCKRFKYLPLVAGGFIAGYLLPYGYYFYLGHSVAEWAQVQKYIVRFYIDGSLQANYGSALTALLSGYIQNLFSHEWNRISEWSPVWILFTLSSFGIILLSFRKTKKKLIVPDEIKIWVVVATITLCILPFWSRYLLIILPFLILCFTVTLKTLKDTLVARALIAFSIVLSFSVFLLTLFPTPKNAAVQFQYNLEHGFFSDIYFSAKNLNEDNSNWQDFNKIGLMFLEEGEIEKVDISSPKFNWSRFTSHENLPMTVKLTTRHLGNFTNNSTVSFIKEGGLWKTVWNWNILIPDADQNSHFITKVDEAKRGSLLNSDGVVLASDLKGILISAIPNKLDQSREDELFSILQNVFPRKIGTVFLSQRIGFNRSGNLPISIGVLSPNPKPELLDTLASFPGVILKPHFIRMTNAEKTSQEIGELTNSLYEECCSYNYTTTSYDGTTGLEGKYNRELKGINGGTLTLIKADGSEKILIKKDKLDGKDALVD